MRSRAVCLFVCCKSPECFLARLERKEKISFHEHVRVLYEFYCRERMYWCFLEDPFGGSEPEDRSCRESRAAHVFYVMGVLLEHVLERENKTVFMNSSTFFGSLRRGRTCWGKCAKTPSSKPSRKPGCLVICCAVDVGFTA